MDSDVWTAVEGEFTGDNQYVVQQIEPFACRYTRMSWATTVGTNGIHAQFVGVDRDSAPPFSSPSLPCIDSAFSGACETLQEKVSAHLARVCESEEDAEETYRREYDENRDDWEARLEAGVHEFEKHYDEQMATLRETLCTKTVAHEARLAEIEQAFLAGRQASLDEAKQRIQEKLADFELDVLGGQVW